MADLHRAALALGAEDDGPPCHAAGQFFAGSFRDPDGNRFCVFVMDRPPGLTD
ncbi:MAG: VOC family protein [Pseudomonadota bacterium]